MANVHVDSGQKSSMLVYKLIVIYTLNIIFSCNNSEMYINSVNYIMV